MRYRDLLLLLVTTVLFSCKKETATPPPVPPVPLILLKDIVIPNLPSPYYHFEYDAAGKPIFASFASGFFMYDIAYSGDRISEMKNNIIVNKDRLQYFYDNAGNVNAIRYADSNGIVYKRIDLTYDGQKLIKLKREMKSGAGFIIDKTMTMSYYADGNLMDLTYHFSAINGQPEHTYTDRFEQYDNKINVDGFSLLHHEFFDHLVFLPGVQLQKNNPGKETRTGEAWNYTVDYTYTYNDRNLPLTKKGDMLVLTGTDAGKRFGLSSFFSYY